MCKSILIECNINLSICITYNIERILPLSHNRICVANGFGVYRWWHLIHCCRKQDFVGYISRKILTVNNFVCNINSVWIKSLAFNLLRLVFFRLLVDLINVKFISISRSKWRSMCVYAKRIYLYSAFVNLFKGFSN